jgi:cytochrome c
MTALVLAQLTGARAGDVAQNGIAPRGPERLILAQGDMTPPQRPVSYSAEQADRGEKKFMKECVECHGKNLNGGLNGGAPLHGLVFEQKYGNGAPASVLFQFVSTMMPPNSPGRFSAGTYADLMAFILKRNGFQPGAPLPSDLDALDNLIIEK